MTSNFDRWEKDPFFSAAEEVQESADRMESAYRRWIHETKVASSIYDFEELRRDLHTAVGTAKWQLEEFERAVRSSYVDSSAEDARARHRHFIVAIENRISAIEISLQESVLAEGKTSLPWVSLDEGERDELALFLTGPSANGDRIPLTIPDKDEEAENPQEMHGETIPDCSKNSRHSAELGLEENREERLYGHRRTASASADIGAFKIAVADHDFGGRPDLPHPRVLSFTGLLRAMESTSKLKNGFKRWKGTDHQQEAETAPLRAHNLTRGISACYERSKSCLDSCDDSYDKQLYSWFGAIQRQFQRSQYQIQYSRPLQVTLWVVIVLCLIVLFVLRAI